MGKVVLIIFHGSLFLLHQLHNQDGMAGLPQGPFQSVDLVPSILQAEACNIYTDGLPALTFVYSWIPHSAAMI